ncbi:hypothetical protein A2881_04470 [Candidatus Peribacteria bacterium RIFCSPHIGHO2_01_FULL_55_13]|nr:MAG: hypothetical protein A2881_04470 [Candidatus Peribacteria bacterium RIFCSPHIGHO2_01_FULL_55_13]
MALDAHELQQWLSRTHGFSEEDIIQDARDPRALALGNIYRTMKEAGGAGVLQALGIIDADGKQSAALDASIATIDETGRRHQSLNLSQTWAVSLRDVHSVLQTSSAWRWLNEKNLRFVEKPDAQRTLQIDKTFAYRETRNQLAEILRPRISVDDMTVINAGGEAAFNYCRDAYRASSLKTQAMDATLSSALQDPEYQPFFVDEFKLFAVEESALAQE